MEDMLNSTSYTNFPHKIPIISWKYIISETLHIIQVLSDTVSLLLTNHNGITIINVSFPPMSIEIWLVTWQQG